MFELFITLFTAHLLGDFVFQTSQTVQKKYRASVIILHATIIAVLSYLLTGIWHFWFIPLIILVSHTIIDWAKWKLSRVCSHSNKAEFILFSADQITHIIIISLLALFVAKSELYWLSLLGDSYLKALTFIAGAILTIKVGGILISMAVKPYLEVLEEYDNSKPRGLPKAGQIIGYLERAMIFIFIIVGFPLGIGFLITAKSVLRFNEINKPIHRMEAEYIIIGTFMSFAYAIGLGWAALAVMSL